MTINPEDWQATDKPAGIRKPRDPSMPAIIKDTQAWWDGIKKGSISFIEGHELIREYIPAYIPGHVIVVGGYTSAGKSQFLNQVNAWATGLKKAKTIVFSLEDSRMERMFGLVSCITGTVHRREMILGTVDNKNPALVYALEQINSWPLKIYDDVYFLADMKKICEKDKPRIVILDYIQKVRCEGSIYDRMSHAAHEVFRYAQDLGQTWIIASQVSVGAAANENPNIISLKGAGDLAETAHAVIQLKKGRKEENKHRIDIEIKKNKAFGRVGKIKCKFNSHWTLIERRSEMDTID